MANIDKKTLERLAESARIDIAGMDEEKLVADLEAILAHFEELKKVDTDNVFPMTGGTNEANVFRGDEPITHDPQLTTKLIEEFHDKKDEFLKVPPIFEG